jgi:hypothetical protein
LNSEVSLRIVRPGNTFRKWPLKAFGVDIYAAGGYVFPDHVTLARFSEPSVESGVVFRAELLRLLPRVLRDAIHSPNPVELQIRIPAAAAGPGIEERNVVEWRWGLAISR